MQNKISLLKAEFDFPRADIKDEQNKSRLGNQISLLFFCRRTKVDVLHAIIYPRKTSDTRHKKSHTMETEMSF